MAGRDEARRGTWAGLSSNGRRALLTFVRGARCGALSPVSRGLIVSEYLSGTAQPEEYLEAVDSAHDRFEPFNLVVGSARGLWHYSHRSRLRQRLTSGFCGLRNADLDTPWFKVIKDKTLLRPLLLGNQVETSAILDALMDEEKPRIEGVPKDTGRSEEWEQSVGSMFVRTPGYGTRPSTVMVFHSSGAVDVVERSYEPGTTRYTTTEMTLHSW